MKLPKKYLVTVIVGLVGVVGILLLKDFFQLTVMSDVFRVLCDAFAVVGVVLACVGLLIFSTNEGTFDGLVYAMKSFADLFRKASEKKYDSYFDYKNQNAKRKGEFGYLLICSLLFIVISLVMLYFYYQYI